ncbi:uncharacterized protein LDX57_011531 [Aspergillus melleus]|uniref:uncharacterized protein n=1 Tax=Aspergillus melleus TaxID=138277 RepID=UPI001E8CC8C5|nr:uncharacterized protein LDX57_011531 [Aspergillus melleus]KAH8433895.1 hypothetical protein LDX57_011531 [Aspergillus melleus]
MPSVQTVLYTTYTIVSIPARLVAILLYYIPQSTRPHPKWTYHQAVGTKVFSLWWRYATAVNFHTRKTLLPGSEGDRFIVIPPPSDASTSTNPTIYRDILLSNDQIQPLPVGAVWYTAPSVPQPSLSTPPARLAIHFHGGAYVLGGARQMESGWGPEVLSTALSCPVLQPQYRLSVAENASFPAALQDAITVYAYALNVLRVPADQIILSGESAGGNLVLAVLRYLNNAAASSGAPPLPLPRAALLWSPWVDLSRAAEDKASSHPRRGMDYLFGELVAWGRERFIPEGWEDEHKQPQSQSQNQANPTLPSDKFAYISPLRNEFYSPTPVFVQTGTAEILYEDHVQFDRGMEEQGTKVEMLEIVNAPHDTFGAGLLVGFAKEAEDAARRAARFVDEAV